MEPQTESHTDVRETDYACFVKAKDKGEPTFTLRAQDITADLVVGFWVKIQGMVKDCMDAGMTMMEAVQAVRDYYFLQPIHFSTGEDSKIDGAVRIAEHMRQWPKRKLAD